MNPATTIPLHPRAPMGAVIHAEPLDAEPLDAEPFDAEAVDAEAVVAGPFDAEAVDAEPIDVRRIRLMQAAGASAVVSEFRTADQVLDRWIGRGRGTAAHRAFTFEITFVDGYILSGCYEFWRGARRRPSLARWVRGLFSDLAAPPAGAAPVDISRYALDTP